LRTHIGFVRICERFAPGVVYLKPGSVEVQKIDFPAFRNPAGKTIAPLAIGVTLIFNIIGGGPLTGAAFNPARALGPMVATGNFSDAWLYLSAPIVGAIIAVILHIGLARLGQERIATYDRRAAVGTPAE
jgi:hypothetical protein